MQINVGATDRIARFAVGIILFALGVGIVANLLEFSLLVGGAALVAGAILVGTAATRMCPIYRVLGVRTCPVESQ